MEISRGVNVTFSCCHSSFILTVCCTQLWYLSQTLSDRELALKRSLAAAAALAFLYDDKEKENASRKELIAAGVYLT